MRGTKVLSRLKPPRTDESAIEREAQPLSQGSINDFTQVGSNELENLKIAIIGAGFAGVGAAIRLRQQGAQQIAIYDRGNEVGGVWRDNTYPGAACDVPTPLYSYSFNPNPRWKWRYGRRDEIFSYIKTCVDEAGLRENLRLNTEVVATTYDERSGKWTVQTSNGTDSGFDILIMACGQLVNPAYPNFKGVGTFNGPEFHTARWDHSIDLKNKRVAIIGTGASAAQVIPEIQPEVGGLKVFMRNPPYLLPRLDSKYGFVHHKIFERLPKTQRAERAAWFGVGEFGALGLIYGDPFAGVLKKWALWNLNRSVKDPELKAKLTPSYEFGCKRVGFSSALFPALAQKNVDVITEGITEVTATGVKTNTGAHHEVDVVIYATGFQTGDFIAPMEVKGIGGTSLSKAWKDGAKAFLGITVPKFPNMFVLYGPNTNLGSNSIIYMIESQINYVLSAAKQIAETGSRLEVKKRAAQRFDKKTQRQLEATVWNSGCDSWYINRGRNTNNWPQMVFLYRRKTRELNIGDYNQLLTSVTACRDVGF